MLQIMCVNIGQHIYIYIYMLLTNILILILVPDIRCQAFDLLIDMSKNIKSAFIFTLSVNHTVIRP